MDAHFAVSFQTNTSNAHAYRKWPGQIRSGRRGAASRLLKDSGIKVCIPGRKSRRKAVKYDKRRYKRRNRIEIMFGRLKDWRRVATRYDRCPETFFSAIMLAATVLFWL